MALLEGKRAVVTGATSDLGARAQVEVHPGDRIRIETPGGGGWGAPRV